MVQYAGLVALLPLAVAAVILIGARALGERAGWLGLFGNIIALALAVGILIEGILNHGVHYTAQYAEYFIWGKVALPIGIQVDGLTAVMLVVVTLVALCVQLYSIGYMHGDKRYTRYFAVVNLFTAGMLGLVLADNFFLLLVSWEIMGLCSFLLISHWYEQEANQWAGIKAFMTTRVGDIGLMVGIWLVYAYTGSFHFAEINAAIVAGHLVGIPLLVGALLIFMGAMGKSAQFPLHTWLPDAMAGPTPASSLIHAATMVAAGVYLVARSYGIFMGPEALAAINAVVPVSQALVVVALIGGFTAVFAASIATLQSDIKKVLAYSTVSQLGYMIMALGVGGWMAAMFHLMTHAFFKALLFQCSGSVIHAVHTQEMHKMGGLRRKLPITFWTWMIGTAALAGLPFFSGFYSKDAILIAAFHWNPGIGPAWLPSLVFGMGLAAAFMTAYYMTRATVLTFFGQPRDTHAYAHAHESPPTMTIPLIILAIPAFASGYIEHWFEEFTAISQLGLKVIHTKGPVPVLATSAALLGIAVGLLIYARGNVALRARTIRAAGPLYTLVKNKYFVDEFYSAVVVRGTHALAALIYLLDKWVIDFIVNLVGRFNQWFADFTGWLDQKVVDGAVNLTADMANDSGRALRKLSTGQVQHAMLTLAVVVVLGAILFQVIGG